MSNCFNVDVPLPKKIAQQPAFFQKIKCPRRDVPVQIVRGPCLHILVVEDNPVNQKLLSLMLQQFGHTSIIAPNGKIGVELYEKTSFDLVLMDIQMPIMDGFEATAAIRDKEKNTGSHVPIIAVTAHVMPGYREKCLENGMDNYIPKPFKMQELKDVITETLQQTKTAS